MRIAVVGGKLQGIEAAYLARMAGWEILMIDKNPDAPARGLADSFFRFDVTSDLKELYPLLNDVELIIPALENQKALHSLESLAGQINSALAFDFESHAVTASKKESDRLFRKWGFPSPQYWPQCGFPLIAKPSGLSGSRGIQKIRNETDLAVFEEKEKKANLEERWIIQEFLEGPSYSIEVIGFNGCFLPLQATVIEVDRTYDCKRVRAPADLPQILDRQFADMAEATGKHLNLKGIMDMEVIRHGNQLKILEIDARLPSQTPTAVLKSTGINMMEHLYTVFVEQKTPSIELGPEAKNVVLEHIRVTPDCLDVCGEHIMSAARPLRHERNFFGADEALTDFDPQYPEWVATLIITDASADAVAAKSTHVHENIQSTFGLPLCLESIPA